MKPGGRGEVVDPNIFGEEAEVGGVGLVDFHPAFWSGKSGGHEGKVADVSAGFEITGAALHQALKDGGKVGFPTAGGDELGGDLQVAAVADEWQALPGLDQESMVAEIDGRRQGGLLTFAQAGDSGAQFGQFVQEAMVGVGQGCLEVLNIALQV